MACIQRRPRGGQQQGNRWSLPCSARLTALSASTGARFWKPQALDQRCSDSAVSHNLLGITKKDRGSIRTKDGVSSLQSMSNSGVLAQDLLGSSQGMVLQRQGHQSRLRFLQGEVPEQVPLRRRQKVWTRPRILVKARASNLTLAVQRERERERECERHGNTASSGSQEGHRALLRQEAFANIYFSGTHWRCRELRNGGVHPAKARCFTSRKVRSSDPCRTQILLPVT